MKHVLFTVLVSAWVTTAAAGQDPAPVVMTPEDAVARVIGRARQRVV